MIKQICAVKFLVEFYSAFFDINFTVNVNLILQIVYRFILRETKVRKFVLENLYGRSGYNEKNYN